MVWVNPWHMVFRHIPMVSHYSVVVSIMKIDRHGRDTNPIQCLVGMLDLHRSDGALNPGRGGEIS